LSRRQRRSAGCVRRLPARSPLVKQARIDFLSPPTPVPQTLISKWLLQPT
jgi:hypothetical protein